MSRGIQCCAVCARDYTNSRRYGVEVPDSTAMVYLCSRCFEVTTNLQRARGGSRWDAVCEMTRRLERMLLGWGTK